MPQPWLLISQGDLKIEQAQCADEGKDLAPFAAEFAALDKPGLEGDARLQIRAGRLIDRTTRLSARPDHPFIEPSKLGPIRRARGPRPKLPRTLPDTAVLVDKAHGAWLGRCCGCTLGKPVEGRRRHEIRGYLEAQGRWPLDLYFSGSAPDAVRQAHNFPAGFDLRHPIAAENLDRAHEDDDTNYTVTGLAVVRNHGGAFTPGQVMDFWAGNIPLLHTCTAERVAYRNFAMGLPVPDSTGAVAGRFSTATYRNVYREWIGAQIRADFFGYCNPGRPERAAEFAWRDACISHIKNGIYGEMWVAAMLAAAFVCDDLETVIRAGLGEVPAHSRLVRDIEQVFQWRREGKTYEQAVDAVHARWDEKTGHHWCHTNSNAQIVALALLWGERDFGRTIAGAVMAGFDTDCNGATAGSVLGAILGRAALPDRWTAPLHDTLVTGVHGYFEVKLADLARETIAIAERVRG